MELVIEGKTRDLKRQKVRNEYIGNDVVHQTHKQKI